MRQEFVPSPGILALVREKVESYDKEGRILVPESEKDWATTVRHTVNPFALVVGVGGPRTLENGQLLSIDVKPGDKVLVAQIGRDVTLYTGDEAATIYVIPFEGVLGKIVESCEVCDALLVEGACPNNCAKRVEILMPTAVESAVILAQR